MKTLVHLIFLFVVASSFFINIDENLFSNNMIMAWYICWIVVINRVLATIKKDDAKIKGYLFPVYYGRINGLSALAVIIILLYGLGIISSQLPGGDSLLWIVSWYLIWLAIDNDGL
jgi:hypothetical protein